MIPHFPEVDNRPRRNLPEKRTNGGGCTQREKKFAEKFFYFVKNHAQNLSIFTKKEGIYVKTIKSFLFCSLQNSLIVINLQCVV